MSIANIAVSSEMGILRRIVDTEETVFSAV